MKKLKWFLLIITIIMMAFFLFATCRKTKAVEMDEIYSVFDGSNTTQVITSTDTNSGFAGVYFFGDPYNINDYVNNLIARILWSDGYIYFRYTANVGLYNVIEILYYDIVNNSSTSLDYIYLNDNNFGFYLILGEDSNADLNMDVVILGYQTSNNNTYVSYTHNYYDFNDYIWGADINRAYNSQTGVTIYYLYQIYFDGMFNAYWFDCLDYSLTFSEMVSDICDKLVVNINQVFINKLYTAGYTTGYQSGYDAGYTAGETAGYTAGYNAGYTAGEGEGYRQGYDVGYDDGYDDGLTAGYNNGYADGLADNVAGQTEAYNAGYGQGRHDGYVEGYDRGYNLGYDDGLANGMSGATPVSQTIGVVSSIFAGVGTVLSVQLFPGFPLGILILVPLFFAVLGLILWIWRRN